MLYWILTDERHKALVVNWFTELLHQGLCLLLGQLLAEVGQQTEQLVAHHGVVVIFIIKLQDLHKVVKTTLVLRVLAGFVHGEHVCLLQLFLSLLGLAADLGDGLQGGVEVAGADEVSGVEGVDIAVTLEVINIESEFDG